MSLITIRNLGVTLSAPLFSNLSFTLDAGDRLGIVAANGRGKSTLLGCMSGSIDATTGDISRARGLRIGHVPQYIPAQLMEKPFYEAVRSGLANDQADIESWRVDIVLDALGVNDELRKRPLSDLSGGWQRLALIARTWMSEPDMLLLDEPTNHLDFAKIALLEGWLQDLQRDMAVVVCSHDRAFLDAVTGGTLFLRPEKSVHFSLPYSRARIALDEADAFDERRYERDIKTARQLRQQAAKLKNIGINSGSDLLVVKTRQLKERATKLEKAARPAHQEHSAGTIQLAGHQTHARVLVTLADARIATPDGIYLFSTGKHFIRQGDRIALLGENGVGKSRFVTRLHDEIIAPTKVPDAHAGTIRATPSLVLGYSDQALSQIGNAETPLAFISRQFELGEPRARSLLAGAGIGIDMQIKAAMHLSGGQKARLAMLALRLGNPNFYLLDEPTNHLDIEGQEALEAELIDSQASCLIVSHDRSFIRAVANRFWLIDKRRLIEVETAEAFFTLL